MNHLKRHLSVANVLSCMALFMAVSGVAYAATLGKNAVKTKNIANSAVTSAKLKNGGVTAAKLANGAVLGSKIANGAVGSAKLTNGAVTGAKLANGAVSDDKLATNAVGTSKLNADSVTTGKIGNEAVTGAKLSASLLAQLVKNVTYETKSANVSSVSPRTVDAECPAGKQVIGGGARVTDNLTGVALTESLPKTNVDNKRTAWTASAREVVAEAGDWTVVAYAICAEL